MLDALTSLPLVQFYPAGVPEAGEISDKRSKILSEFQNAFAYGPNMPSGPKDVVYDAWDGHLLNLSGKSRMCAVCAEVVAYQSFYRYTYYV